MEGIAHGTEPTFVIDEEFSLLERAGIRLQQDGVQRAVLAGQGGRGEIVDAAEAAVLKAIGLGEKFLLPRGKFAQWLEDGELGFFLRDGSGHGSRQGSQSQAEDEHFRLPRRTERVGAEFSELDLGHGGSGARPLLSVRVEVEAAIVLMEFDGAAIGQGGMGVDDAWFHED